jgi:hypothetical protein
MLFDKLAGFVERHVPKLVGQIEKTALFDFPYRAHEAVRPGMFAQDDLEQFFLPFPQIAIEDRATCTFLFDGEEKQVGLSAPRYFIDVIALGAPDLESFKNSTSPIDGQARQWARQEGLHQFAFGQLFSMELPESGKDYKAAGSVDRLVLLNGRGEILTDMNSHELRLVPGAADTYQGIIGNAITAIEELMLINRNPEYFILEQSPLKTRQTKKGRITRSPDRSKYIPLKPDAIRKTMGLKQPENQNNTKRPHERRRHWRQLKSERYTHKRGQRVLVEACWVGPSEAVVGKTQYRVRLDI